MRLRWRTSLRKLIKLTIALFLSTLAGGLSPAVSAERIPIVLVFGDSFTAGLGISHESAFPAQLELWLRSKGIVAKVINGGISGETTAKGLLRLDEALSDRPDLVILELGANDALRGIHPTITHQNLHSMIVKIESTGAKLLLTGILAPPNWGEQYKKSFDNIYPDLARKERVPIYPFFIDGVALKSELNQPDRLHPNKRGVLELVNRIGPIILGCFPTDMHLGLPPPVNSELR